MGIENKLGQDDSKKYVQGFVLSAVSGALILLQGIFRVVHVQWAWELGVGELRRHNLGRLSLAELGIGTMVLGIIILLGALLIFKGRAKEGAIIVIALSTVSIFTGGGYLVGLVLGVVGGAVALSKV